MEPNSAEAHTIRALLEELETKEPVDSDEIVKITMTWSQNRRDK
jgi:hypothetical protein